MAVKNYHASVQKWEEILSFCESIPGGVKGEDWEYVYGALRYLFAPLNVLTDVGGPCGYCHEFAPGLRDCKKCPLYPRICGVFIGRKRSLFKIIHNHFIKTNRITPKTICLVKRMLAEVKKHKDKF